MNKEQEEQGEESMLLPFPFYFPDEERVKYPLYTYSGNERYNPQCLWYWNQKTE